MKNHLKSIILSGAVLIAANTQAQAQDTSGCVISGINKYCTAMAVGLRTAGKQTNKEELVQPLIEMIMSNVTRFSNVEGNKKVDTFFIELAQKAVKEKGISAIEVCVGQSKDKLDIMIKIAENKCKEEN